VSAGLGPWAVSDMWRGNSECGPLHWEEVEQLISKSRNDFNRLLMPVVPVIGVDIVGLFREANIVGCNELKRMMFPEAATDPWEEQG